MDRIQKALDLSRSQQRPYTAPPAEDHRNEREALAREFSQRTVEYHARLKLDWPALRHKRVICGDDKHAAGHAYRMLRTQILQRSRAHGLHTIGIASATNGEGNFDQIAFWKTPVSKCASNPETGCVPYYRWVSDYIAILGGR